MSAIAHALAGARAAAVRWLLGALLVLGLAVFAASAAFAIDITTFDDPVQQQRYRELTHELRCMQCLNTSIADSNVDLAADLRREVADLIHEGKTDNEIRQFMVDRYGEFILFRPLKNARNMWLWVAPGAFLAIGVLVAIRVIRQRAKLVTADDDPVEGDEPAEEKAGR